VNVLSSFLINNEHLNCVDKIAKGFMKCRAFLRNNDDLLITNADKGKVTIIMDKNTYVNQMKVLLNDKNTYIEIKKDPNNKITNRLNNFTKSLLDLGYIDECTYNYDALTVIFHDVTDCQKFTGLVFLCALLFLQ